jgi:multidrug efflux pump subunit AcrA (membrane-fusion protein)
MMNRITIVLTVVLLYACSHKVEKTKPTTESITESIYASGIIKSANQYQVFAPVNGIIDEVYLTEGDSVIKGTRILSISNETQKLNQKNAELAAGFNDYNANQGKLNEARQMLELARSKAANDSALYFRQKNLWDQQIGSRNEFEMRQLAYQNSKATLVSATVKLNDLKRQLEYSSAQAKQNLKITEQLTGDYTLKSEVDGIIYSIGKTKGEMVGVNSPLAVIGSDKDFILELQVDEYDILKVRLGQLVLITMDSYRGKVFEAIVTKIEPIMNERSKTFVVEATFKTRPEVLYPNITFEANIVLEQKDNALLIPRNYLINESQVIKSNGDTVQVAIGLKDYQKVEILSGITAQDELLKPDK